MKENMDQLKGLVNSQQVLLKLTQSNISREDAYSIVQEIAMQVWDGKGSFLSLLKENKHFEQFFIPSLPLPSCTAPPTSPSSKS